MVDGLLLYGFCRWLGSVQRGATSLAYWGIFSDTEYCGSENSLISYGIFRANTYMGCLGLDLLQSFTYILYGVC